jgi:hypothetical protein
MNNDFKQYFKEKDIAQILGISAATIRTWRNRGSGPSYIKCEGKKGSVLYPIIDFNQWLEDRKRR